MALALALAGVPVWLLTRPDAPTPETRVSRPEVDPVRIAVRITSSHPARVKASVPDRVLIDTREPSLIAGAGWDVNPSAPDDLLVQAEWIDASHPHALRVEILRDEEVLKDQTFWGDESIEDVVTPPAL